MKSTMKCPICSCSEIEIFFETKRVPKFCNVLLKTCNEAESAPTGDIALGFCGSCTHVFNTAFSSDVTYTPDYDNTLHHSPAFQNYAESLAAKLIEKYALRNKDVIEIGCGKGEFLELMAALGPNRAVGFDRSSVERAEGAAVIIRDFYSEKYSHYPADLVLCRQVLEHVEFPLEFLSMVRGALGDKSATPVFFEVPNVDYTLDKEGIWDIIYEHVHYFGKDSLKNLFDLAGLKNYEPEETFDDQFLCIEAVLSPSEATGCTATPKAEAMREKILAFKALYEAKVALWTSRLEEIRGLRKRAVVWGAGSKGVTFLNVMRTVSPIIHAVDLNHNKHGKYVPVSGQMVIGPRELKSFEPDVVIVMNAVYVEEIKNTLGELGIAAEILLA